MKGLRRALAFITVLPISIEERMGEGELGRAAAWFPAIGLAMGGILWGVARLLAPLLPGDLVATVLVTVWVLLSGGLHLDGFADSCDALFASAGPERRLKILRDTGVGAFATVGIVLLLLLKTMAVASLVEPAGLLLAPVLGRWTMLPLARGAAARAEGLGARLHDELTADRMWPGLVLALVLSAVLGWPGLAAFVMAHVGALAWGELARRRLGGQTGDVLGGACEGVEVIVLFVFAWGG